MYRSHLSVLTLLLFGVAACSRGSNNEPAPAEPPPSLQASHDYRALAGVSMGAYGAFNVATKHDDLFSNLAALGGPVDMTQLIADMVDQNLEVKPQTDIPRAVGSDFTFDHLAPYPDRDTRITMFQDLVIAFGNPFLHHPDSAHAYLASDSEPAHIQRDDVFGSFSTPTDPRGFRDGGDVNQDGLRQTSEAAADYGDVGLLARGSLGQLAPGASAVDVGGRMIVDLNGDGVFDVGEGLVVNLSEPFTDGNHNHVYEPALGETYNDLGLDGVAGTNDYGEGNGQFDYDPDRAHWLDQDPLARIVSRDRPQLEKLHIYMDVGKSDEFGFAIHYDHVVAALQQKGLAVTQIDGLRGNCTDLSGLDDPRVLVRYNGGHIGVAAVDPNDLLEGDVCGRDTVWQRLLSMLAFFNKSFAGGYFGVGDQIDVPEIHSPEDLLNIDLDFTGDVMSLSLPSPALANGGGAVPTRDVVVYRPPAYFHTDRRFPVVYFLGGYGQKPGDFVRSDLLLDLLIITKKLQNMFVVFLPGDGARQGSFYVNHVVAHSQVPELEDQTSGRYEDSIVQDLIPAIESGILGNRVKF